MSWKRVVVGVDGSAGSERALRWAAGEARARGAELTVLTAYALPVPPAGAGYSAPQWVSHDAWRHEDQLRAHAEELLRTTVADTLGDDPGVVVAMEAVEGPAARALIEASSDADLVVVGSRGLGGFSGMLLGSVSQHLVPHAACPVTVVP